MHLQNLYHKKMQTQIKQYYMHSIVRLGSVKGNPLTLAEHSDTEDES